MSGLHFDPMKFYEPENRQMRYRLNGNLESLGAVLENVIGKLFIYWSLTDPLPIYKDILDQLNIYSGVIPRLVYYGPKDMEVEETKKGLWRYEKDPQGRPCQIRIDSGVGQMPIALIGLYRIWKKTGSQKAKQLWEMQSRIIAKNNYQMQYKGEVVPQGSMFSYFPLPVNNCVEAQCISEMAKIPTPWKQRLRVGASIKYPMPWDDQRQREIFMWFLANMNPGKYKDIFECWIKTRDTDFIDMQVRYTNNVEDNSDVFKADLDYLIGDEIRKGKW